MTTDPRRSPQGRAPARWARRPAPVVLDVGLFAAVAAVAAVMYATGSEAGARSPDVLGALLLVVSAAPLLARRRWPLLAFLAQLAIVLVYLGLDYPGGAELPVVLAGIYSVAASGYRWWTLGLVLGFVALGSLHRVVVEGEDAMTVTIGSSLLVLVGLLGDSVSTRRQLRDETRRRLAVMAAEKEADARARVAEERLRLAHELHDVMAHTITVMTVQAGAAADQLDHDPERAREALGALRGAARDAMAELRTIIAVLRAPGEGGRGPAPGVARVDELAATARTAGLDVTVDVDLASSPLPAAVDVTGFRVVQEALTNVVRHAQATSAAVRVRIREHDLVVEVTDDGQGPGSASGGGHGLVGLRERVSAVGGTLEAGPGPGGGFRVGATLPMTMEADGP